MGIVEITINTKKKGIRWMRSSHTAAAVSAVFDDPNLVSCAGLEPVARLAARAGLHDLVAERVGVNAEGGANAHLKVPALVLGMVAGADSIDDMDLLRHGGMGHLFAGARAPSTLGTFLRALTFGHVRQLDSVARGVLAGLSGCCPLLAGAKDASGLAYVDIDDTVREVHGYAKAGAGYGYSGVNGLNALIATIATPVAAPVILAARLRKGATNSARGAARLLTEALNTASGAGVESTMVVRMDSAYYTADMVAAARKAGARFSVTARMNPAVRAAIAGVEENAWTPIKYPNAVWDEAEQRWVSDAEIAEVAFTAFTGRPKQLQVTARLIVRRVKRLNAKAAEGQDELFAAHRYHAAFTDSPLRLVEAEAAHRGHAIIEQVIADLKAGPLAHLPSGSFAANSAWLVLAAIAFNLTRAAGALASIFHAKATTATVRAQLINVPARLARSARRIVMHLPEHWPWEDGWTALFTAGIGPPRPATP